MSGANLVTGGETGDAATITQLVAIETLGTHAGTPNYAANVSFNGQLIVLLSGVPFIAEPGQFVAINAADPNLMVWAS